MHANDTVEVAGVVATQAAVLHNDRGPPSASSFNGYWYASRDRLETWAACLSAHRRRAHGESLAAATEVDLWCLRVIHELFATELLTRVWTSVVAGFDAIHRDNYLPACHGIFVSHRDLARQSMHDTVEALINKRNGSASIQQEAAELKRFRSRVERWTDLLVGFLVVRMGDTRYAFDPDRAMDFAAELRRHGRVRHSREAWKLTLQSLRQAFRYRRLGPSPHADRHRRVAHHILASFEPSLVDSVDTFRSLWTTRLINRADDAEAYLNQWWQAQ